MSSQLPAKCSKWFPLAYITLLQIHFHFLHIFGKLFHFNLPVLYYLYMYIESYYLKIAPCTKSHSISEVQTAGSLIQCLSFRNLKNGKKQTSSNKLISKLTFLTELFVLNLTATFCAFFLFIYLFIFFKTLQFPGNVYMYFMIYVLANLRTK